MARTYAFIFRPPIRATARRGCRFFSSCGVSYSSSIERRRSIPAIRLALSRRTRNLNDHKKRLFERDRTILLRSLIDRGVGGELSQRIRKKSGSETEEFGNELRLRDHVAL